MEGTGIDKVIEEFSHLPLADKEYVLEVITKQIIEAKRETLALRAAEALSNYERGLIKKGSIKDLHEDLESD